MLISKTLTAGTALYNFSDLSNDAVFDVIGIAVINGSTRIQLNQYSYSELSVAARAWTTYQSLPRAFCRYGPSQVYLAPIPVSAYVSEWDCSVYSDPLVATTDVDPLPFPYTKPVAYYAAYEAKLYERAFDEADAFLTQYQQQLQVALTARVGTVPSLYSGVVRV